LAWQFAFFIIATDPARYRPRMIVSVFEKFSYGIAVVLLVIQHRTRASDLVLAGWICCWVSCSDCFLQHAASSRLTIRQFLG
jgi:VanZ family protein